MIVLRVSRLLLAPAAALMLLSSVNAASAQDTVPPTKFERELSKVDLSINGVGEFNTTVSGPVIPASFNQGATVTQFASNTLGAMVGLHYSIKPYVGLEFNYGFARYTENYTAQPLQIQTTANEFTFGYLVRPPHPIFGLQPFASAGTGSIEFKPTAGGGQQAPRQARQVYYYAVGVQQEVFSPHFGLRAGFRQLFYLDPDFGQNYLTIKKHASTYEPMVGLYLRY